MEKTSQNKNEKSVSKSMLKLSARVFMIIALAIFLSSIFLTWSLREVYMNDSSDSSFKDYKKEYKALEKGEDN